MKNIRIIKLVLIAFIFTLTSTNNGICTSISDEVKVTRDTSLIVIHAGSVSMCAGQSTTLTAAGTPSVLWSGGSSASSIVVSPLITSVYTATGTTTLNCSYADSVTLTVSPLPAVNASSSATLICLGESLSLNATGATNYTWSTVPAFSASVIASPAISTVYQLSGVDDNGCKNIDSVAVVVSECAGLSAAEKMPSSILLYPNPNKGDFTISSQQDIRLKLINELGQLIRIVELNEQNQHKALVSGLAQGIYFVCGLVGKEVFKQKIIVDK